MRHCFGVKFLSVLAAALALVLVLGSTACVIFLCSHSLYTISPQEMERNYMENKAINAAEDIAQRYALRTYGKVPQVLKEYGQFADNPFRYENDRLLCYTISDTDGNVLENTYTPDYPGKDWSEYGFSCSVQYPVAVPVSDTPSTTVVRDEAPETGVTSPVRYSASPTVGSDWSKWEVYDCQNGESYEVYYYDAPTVVVDLWMSPEIFNNYGTDYWYVINLMYALRYWLVVGLLAGLVVLAAALTYLSWAVGWKKDADAPVLAGLNRLPLDLYSVGAGCLGFLGSYLALLLLRSSIEGSDINFALVILACASAVLVAVLAVLLYCAVAAQVKQGRWLWWTNSLVGRVASVLWRLIRGAFRGLMSLVRLLPIVWLWLLIIGVLAMVLVICATELHYGSDLPFFLCLMLLACVIGYSAWALGTVFRGARNMAKGDLSRKIPEQYLIGNFRTCARDLNALAEVSVEAARKQLQSERMKTELITNVSHDIKTPLTSIINFVDLLQKPHTQDQEQEYLAVLSRQSLRLKKLIEDLMELSKASTGNLSVNPMVMDAREAVHQALGEFSDKLSAARLTPVLRCPDGSIPILADGRLVWRVLSNLLSNVVKYALPGTRIYIDVVQLEDRVLVSLKNISREELNLSAQELMERFVRGDASRNTEGSGLGLNIARSLMEVQKGQLQLLVDGDLFKVTLVFPGA